MEELLNKIIEKGWKPRGENVELYWTSKDSFWERIVIFIGNAGWFKKWWCTYRELVSKESWLWQFVCENEMVNLEYDITESYKDSRHREQKWWYNWDRYLRWYDMYGYQYRLIESALLDEDKLEDFLLDNIKID